jgi:chromosome segregation ATPase
MKPFSPRLASAVGISCAALFAATGCVSQKEFSQACHERDQLASALDTTRQDRARISADLSSVSSDRDEARAEIEDLASTLQGALDRSDALEHNYKQSHASLEQTQATLASAQRDLSNARMTLAALERSTATIREQLAVAVKRGEELGASLHADQDAFASYRSKSEAQAEEVAATLKQVRLDLAEAQKDQSALVSTRQTLTELQKTDTEERQQLTQSQQAAAELTTQLKSASAQITDLKNQAHDKEVKNVAARIAQADIASANLHKVQAELESLKTRQAEAEHAATDAKARLAGAEKRAADLEAQVKTLNRQARAATPDTGDKSASAANTPHTGPAKTASAKSPPSEPTASVRSSD